MQEMRWWASETQRLTSASSRMEQAGHEAAKTFPARFEASSGFALSARGLIEACRESGLAPERK